METNSAGSTASMGAPVSGGMAGSMSAPDQGFEGGTVFESPVQGKDAFAQEADVAEDFTPDESRQIMDIKGTAHDKLEVLAEMDEDPEDSILENSQETNRENNEPRSNSRQETAVQPEFSPEQQVMALQAEAIKILAEALREGNGGVDKQELEELIKKLKKLLETSQNADNKDKKESKNGMVVNTTLSLLGLMFVLSEKAINEAEEEASKN